MKSHITFTHAITRLICRVSIADAHDDVRFARTDMLNRDDTNIPTC